MSDSLRAQLAEYLIGQKLRALRLRRSMGLMQLGARTGLSAALLSKIENCKLVPTIPTLLRIALALEVNLDYFFQNEQRRHLISLTRKEDRDQMPAFPQAREDSYILTRLDIGTGERKFCAYLAEFCTPPNEDGKAHAHLGFEFLHVLNGTLRLQLGSDERLMSAGDSIYFDSTLQHAYARVSEDKCIAFMVLAYPEHSQVERRVDNLDLYSMRRKPLKLNADPPAKVRAATASKNGVDDSSSKEPKSAAS